jgi:hypothetical protein
VKIVILTVDILMSLKLTHFGAGCSGSVLESDIVAVVSIGISVCADNVVDSLYLSEMGNIKNIFFYKC